MFDYKRTDPMANLFRLLEKHIGKDVTERWIRNTDYQAINSIIDIIRKYNGEYLDFIISSGFFWQMSPEGSDYWERIDNSCPRIIIEAKDLMPWTGSETS